ncbi:MAG: hypothetical protein LIP23_05525 [Planctomycetes bacterium]|nr:hypothetical protein [Planctomycetota bacterium]
MANEKQLATDPESVVMQARYMDRAVEILVEQFLDGTSNPKSKTTMDGHSEAEWAESLLTYLYRYFMEYAQHGLLIQRHNSRAIRAIASVFLAPEYAGILFRYYRCAHECDSHLTYVGDVSTIRREFLLAKGIRSVIRYGIPRYRFGAWDYWNSLQPGQGIFDMISLFYLSATEIEYLKINSTDREAIMVCANLFELLLGKIGWYFSEDGLVFRGLNNNTIVLSGGVNMADSKYVFNNPGVINIQDNSTTTNNLQSGIIGSGTVQVYHQNGKNETAEEGANTASTESPKSPAIKKTANIKELQDYTETLMGRALADGTIRNILKRAGIEPCGEEMHKQAKANIYPWEPAQKALSEYVIANKKK